MGRALSVARSFYSPFVNDPHFSTAPMYVVLSFFLPFINDFPAAMATVEVIKGKISIFKKSGPVFICILLGSGVEKP